MASTSNDASSTSINTKKLRRALLKTLPKRRTPVDLGILVKYWPLGEMEGTRKDQAFLKGLTDERVKCGEYNSQYKAYPIFLSKKVGSSASSKTRAFCPAAYRPALRILNCRIAFTLVGLETKPDPSLMNKRRPASPDVENVADEVAALSDSDSHRLVAEKYALCRDGYLRNVQYHTVVRREFFAWLDKTYYDNKVGTDRLPLKKPMQVQRCDILEAWLAVELLGANHSSDAIIRLINDSEKMKVLEAAKDVFRLSKLSGFLYILSTRFTAHQTGSFTEKGWLTTAAFWILRIPPTKSPFRRNSVLEIYHTQSTRTSPSLNGTSSR
jgi:hypothetical protein